MLHSEKHTFLPQEGALFCASAHFFYGENQSNHEKADSSMLSELTVCVFARAGVEIYVDSRLGAPRNISGWLALHGVRNWYKMWKFLK